MQKMSLGRRILRNLRYNGILHLMCLPVVLGVILFSYLPKIGVVMAFQDLDFQKGLFTSPWVRFDNFKFLFSSTITWRVTRNTVLYAIWFMFIGTLLAILLAMLINEVTKKRTAKWLQTVYMMPNFRSIIAVTAVAQAFLRDTGFVNNIFKIIGLPKRNWYAEPGAWPLILTITRVWLSVGFSSVIYLATISGINDEYYEAAVIDGATRLQQALYVTLPFLRPMITILLIFSIGGIMSGDFGLHYTVTGNMGALYETTDILDTYIFRSLQTMTSFGRTTAAGLYQSGVGFLLLLLANFIIKRIEPDHAIF